MEGKKRMIIGMPFDYEVDEMYELQEQRDYAKRLLYTSTYEGDIVGIWEIKIENGDLDDVYRYQEHFKLNQVDIIAAGKPYNQGDIQKKLNNERQRED